jgi:EmrB/QacA subfamily drug resistance transporter
VTARTAAAQPAAPRKRLVLVACIAGSSVVFVDGTVVNVALPAIDRDLGGGLAGQQWVTNAYLITLSSLLLIGGSLGDIFGERRVFSIGIGAFGVTSVLCAVAPTIEVLIAGRALQGVAGALLVPATLAVIVAVFPENERGAAVGTWTAWTGISTVLGPVVGGQLVDVASWRWVFGINVPLVIATLALLPVALPAGSMRTTGGRVDAIGAVLAALGLAGPVFALIEQPRLGWGDPSVLIPLVAGLVLLAAFLVWERRASHPMLDLELFRRRNFTIGNVETFGMYAGLSILFFLLVIFLQQVVGLNALEAGAATLPVTVVLFVLSRRFGALADRYGPRALMGSGPLVGAAGMLLLLLSLDADLDYLTELLPGVFLFALGLSMTVAPLTAAVLAGVEERHAGIASGINNAIARVAGLVGIAAIGVLVSGQFSSTLDDRLAGRSLSGPAESAIARAKEQPLGGASVSGVPAAERGALEAAFDDASISAFRMGLGIAALLLVGGGVMAAIGIQNPRRRVRAEDCPGGQLAGHPSEPCSVGAPARSGEAPAAA